MPFLAKFLRFAICLTALMVTGTVLRAQIIAGKVIDSASGKPIGGASVYLNGTYQGVSSNSEGNFQISTSERHIPLVVSCVGYLSQTIGNYTGKKLNILLKRKPNVLKEVSIGYHTISREEEIKIFLREFIGTKNNECTIANLDDVKFDYEKKANRLAASADQPLIIYNKKLGYKITYFLSLFIYTPMETAFQGYYFFTDNTPGLSADDGVKIIRAREKAYQGSRMHFIRALWANDLANQGFAIYDIHNKFIDFDDIIVLHGDAKFIGYSGFMRIAYGVYISTIGQGVSGKEIFIGKNGFYDPRLRWDGEMGAQRVGEMLPFEYQPIK